MNKNVIIVFVLILMGLNVWGADRPNIVFIFADDWGWGDLSCHGHEYLKTPNIDRFAKQGINFHQFTVASGVCSPSRTAVMTGQFPARHSVHQHFASIEHHVKTGMPDWLDPDVVMLPRLLKKAGYKTGHFGKWHLTNRNITDAPLPEKYGYDEAAVFNGPGKQTTPRRAYDDAIAFIKKNKGESFFVNLWIHETHTPHYPAKKYLEQYKHLEETDRVYAAVVAEADYHFGRVIKAIDELGLGEKTLIVFSSDNGPENQGKKKATDDLSTGRRLGTYYSVGQTGGLRGQKRSLFEGGVRVPFMVRWLGTTLGGKVNQQTVLTGVDLLPTFLAAGGVALPAGYKGDGENMLAAFKGEKIMRKKPIFWSWKGTQWGENWPRFAVRDGDWKLVVHPERKRTELYHIPNDRGELKDLSGRHADVVARLTGMLADWRKTLPEEPPKHCLSKLREK